MAKYYWLFVVYGGESWYSPVPEGASVNLVDVSRRLVDLNWDVELETTGAYRQSGPEAIWSIT